MGLAPASYLSWATFGLWALRKALPDRHSVCDREVAKSRTNSASNPASNVPVPPENAEFASRQRHDVVEYELRALAGLYQVAAQAAGEAGIAVVELPQGYGLVPITAEVFEGLGGGPAKPFGNAFRFLSSGVESLAHKVSHAGPTAYLEAEMFGGTGTQSMVGWRDGEIWLGPVTAEFRWPPPDPASNPHWAFNYALRELGVDRGEAFDEFDALNLGKHRHTEDWTPTA